MSKNRREKLEGEIRELEATIAKTEAELTALETSFQNPTVDANWEAAHRRYAELRTALDGLYNELALRWDLLG